MSKRQNHRQLPSEVHRPYTDEDRQIKKLTTWFYGFTKLYPKQDDTVVNIGFTYPIDHKDFIIFFMEQWVKWTDAKLDKLQEGTDAYADLFGTRGFSYQEFSLLVSGKVKEEFFERFRVFDYFYITDQTERDYITSLASAKEVDVLDAYIEAISGSIKTEISLLNRFFFQTKIPLYFSLQALKQHSYILAQSGSGKSELIKLLIFDLQRRSHKTWSKSLILIEPHGDLCNDVLSFVFNKGKAKKRLVYLDPFIRDTARQIFGEDILGADYTFVLNPFDIPLKNDGEINRMTQMLSSAFFEILKNEATTQMEAIIDACIETLLRKEGTSISDLKRFMNNEENADLIEAGMNIPNIERQTMMKRFKEDKRINPTKSGIYYRLQSLIGDMVFRRILVGKSTVDLDKEMNAGKVIICNLSKAKMGVKSAPAFGKLLLALIQGIVTKRQDIRPERRKETYCFIDEFQNYVTPTVQEIMAETRKYSLHMTLANQVIGQNMDTQVKRSILGNTAIKIAGDNEPDSLDIMTKQMGKLSPKDFERLPKYSFYAYNKFNKKSGVHTVRVPDFLVKKKPPFYLSKKELKGLFLYLVHESGYYIRVSDTKEAIPKASSNTNNKPTDYTHDFTD